jgi:hypothetical protein
MDMENAFILGAGFSVDEQFPLMRGLKERVFHFLEAERHSSYAPFLMPGNGGFTEGQFQAGLRQIDGAGTLEFEGLLIALRAYLKTAGPHDPAHVILRVLRIGCARLLWCIHNSIWRVDPHYLCFAQAVAGSGDKPGTVVSFNWDLVAERAFHDATFPWAYTRGQQNAVPVLKPHGSINWSGFLRESLKSDYAGWAPIASHSRLSYDRFNPLSNPDMQDINPYLRYMIFPGDSESAEDPDLKLIWNDVCAAIQSSEAVVFIGYSLPDYDSWSRRFFAEVCAGKAVEIYNPSPAVLTRFREVFGEAAEVHQQTFGQCVYCQG